MTAVEAALGYAARGWRVFPLNGKVPQAGTHGFKDATVDADQIRSWPADANVGVATGGGLVVIDIDDRHGGGDTLAELEVRYGRLPDTVSAETGGGGEHLYFRTDKTVRSSAGVLGDGLDVRGERGYAVLPPSIHPSGRRYEWDNDPAEIEIAPLPGWLEQLLAERDNRKAPPIGETIPHGKQHDTLVSLAGSMRRRGAEAPEIAAALKEMNRRRCEQPGTDAEMDKIAESMMQYAPEPASKNEEAGAPRASQAEQVDTAILLDEVMAFVRRFVLLPGAASYRTVALYVLHSWAIGAAYSTPYIVVESPEKQAGKTRLLETFELVCRNPVKAASVTAAAIFQTVAHGRPTLLLDEADAIFAGNSERCEDLRGVLNAGNAPGSVVIRGGKTGEPVRYDVFCPKVICGIATGKLPDTIRDRAIVIPIDRKLKTERVERLRRRRIDAEVEQLRARLQAWAEANEDALSQFDLPGPITEISDRLEEAWEPLLAIASLAGDGWAGRARLDAIALAGEDEDEGDWTHRLLLELEQVVDGREVMFTRDILATLNQGDGWEHFNDGTGLKARDLGRVAKRYKIPHNQTVRDGDRTAKGYRREWFEEAWLRYGGAENRSHRHIPLVEPKIWDSVRSQIPACDLSENAANPLPERVVTDVTDKTPPTRPGGHIEGAGGGEGHEGDPGGADG